MSKTWLFLSFVLTIVFTNKVIFSQTKSIDAPRQYQAVAERLTSLIERESQQKNLPALSIALVDGDKIVWARGFGLSDPENKIPATAETVYRVGSVSKLLSDVAVMQLVNQAKLQLDAPIQDVLPDFKPRNRFGRPITLRQLMSHRSGLVRESPVGNYFDDNEPTLAETVYSLNDTDVLHASGSATKYSNAAVSVAGYAAEKVTGTPFADHVKSSLLLPLHMTSSSFVYDESVNNRLAKAYMWSHDGRRFEAPNFTLGTLPAGNLYSSVIDLGNFMRAIFNGGSLEAKQVIDADLLAEMLSPATGPDGQHRLYGIGFRVSELDGARTFEHGGAVYGFSTQFRGMQNEKLGVVAVASLDGVNGVVSRIGDHALRQMKAAKTGTQVDQLASSHPLSVAEVRQLAGLYQHQDQFRRLFESGGRLQVLEGSFQRELRRAGDRLVIDDFIGFGPYVEITSNGSLKIDDVVWKKVPDELPPAAPSEFNGLIGEYGWDYNTMFVYEQQGRLWTLIEWFYHYPLTKVGDDKYAFPDYGLYHAEHLIFQRAADGQATNVITAEVDFPRRNAGPNQGETFKIQPLLPADRLREIALSEEPPPEAGDFFASDLVGLTSLDPSIKLDIRYATTNNFMSQVFYEQPRAFMQRPAAEAVVRAHRSLKEKGYGLLIHDAYRPWFVTKMFWEATPPNLRQFVADPQRGSRHNRGCAVDLTLYDLSTGQIVPMVAGYDEFSARAYPDYRGGTARQRWHRRLLRQAMESAGFEIYEFEWWHFDFHQWRSFRISNKRFAEIESGN